MSKPEPAAKSPDKEKKTGSNPLLIPMLLLGTINLGGTGFVAFKVMKPVKVEAAAPAPTGEGVAGPVVTLDPFVVNLNEAGSSRFLKANFEVELTSPHAVEEMDKAKRVVRDELLRYLSGLTSADTMGEQGKAKIRDEVTFRIDKALGGGRVRRTFFAEFVVQ